MRWLLICCLSAPLGPLSGSTIMYLGLFKQSSFVGQNIKLSVGALERLRRSSFCSWFRPRIMFTQQAPGCNTHGFSSIWLLQLSEAWLLCAQLPAVLGSFPTKSFSWYPGGRFPSGSDCTAPATSMPFSEPRPYPLQQPQNLSPRVENSSWVAQSWEYQLLLESASPIYFKFSLLIISQSLVMPIL